MSDFGSIGLGGSSAISQLTALCSNCDALKTELEESKRDFEEFQTESREYEAELDREVSDLKKRNQQLIRELDEFKNRFTQHQAESNKTINSLQQEVDLLRKVEKEFRDQTRELEIMNSELEQNYRVKSVSAEDMENKYNKALERTIFLEHELDSKAQVEEESQRLKDDLRDAMNELSVVRAKLEGKERLLSALTSSSRSLESPLSLTTAFSEGDATSAPLDDAVVAAEHVAPPAQVASGEDIEMVLPPKSPPVVQAIDEILKDHTVPVKLKMAEEETTKVPQTGAITTLNELLQRAKSLELRITAARDKYVQPLLVSAASSNPLSPPLKASSLNMGRSASNLSSSGSVG
ncbi:NADH:ubiquinone oxidoreductase [Dinochytrium kinnereticum]|nr:NADH:ubiquinone oxidoreductase [Dinochytrium kinnereticum]